MKDKCLLLANHQTYIDFFNLIKIFATTSRLGTHHVLWVINQLFLYTPMGLLAVTRKYFFLSKQNKVSSLIKKCMSIVILVYDHKQCELFTHLCPSHTVRLGRPGGSGGPRMPNRGGPGSPENWTWPTPGWSGITVGILDAPGRTKKSYELFKTFVARPGSPR